MRVVTLVALGLAEVGLGLASAARFREVGWRRGLALGNVAGGLLTLAVAAALA